MYYKRKVYMTLGPIVQINFVDPETTKNYLTHFLNIESLGGPEYIKTHWTATTESDFNNLEDSIKTGILDIYKRTKIKLEKEYGLDLILKRCFVHTMSEGYFGDLHTDYGAASKESGKEEQIYSGLFYFNDQYIGGEINFTTINFKIKPLPGTLIYFDGRRDLPHQVEIIQSGERTVFVMFFNPVD